MCAIVRARNESRLRARGRGLRGGAPERRRRRGGDWPFGAERATGRTPAGPARPSLRPQPRTSEPERSYPRPAHGGGLKKTLPCARPRRSTPGEVGPPVVAVGGGPRHIGARRAEGPGRERGWRSARAEATSGGAGCPCRCARRVCGWWRWVLAGGRLARRRTSERSATERSVRAAVAGSWLPANCRRGFREGQDKGNEGGRRWREG